MNQDSQWSEEVWNRITKKIERTSQRIGSSFPHGSINGVYDSMEISKWTNGFWPGILWQLNAKEKNACFQEIAEQCEEKLDEALNNLSVHHDVGFIWLLSSVANYKLTGNPKSKERGVMAASQLASRFNIKGYYIRAWHNSKGIDRAGWSIIDTLMNLSLLYWASDITNDPRFKHIAVAHTDTVMKYFLRPDGSSYHILCFDAETGELVGPRAGQGAAEESAWARGSAWTIYGLTNAFRHTKDERYLQGAKMAANFFLANLPEDFVPHWDFRVARTEQTPRDSSAGAIAASGMIDLAALVPKEESHLYFSAAKKMLRSLDENYGAWDSKEEALIIKGTSNFNSNTYVDTPLIYGDYYFVEAIAKLNNHHVRVW